MHRERRYQTGVKGTGSSIITRRQFLENAALIGGGLFVTGAGVDYAVNSMGIAEQVNVEIPYILRSKRISTIRGIVDRLSELPTLTSNQQAAQDSAQTLIDAHFKNEEVRSQRAGQLQYESDETPVLGLVKRGSLRLWAVGLGVVAFVAGLRSKIARD